MKNNRGITIIALIVTIIVLLILAGITIQAISEDGIIGRAEQAKTMQIVANLKERIMLDSLENSLAGKQNSVELLLKEGKVTRTVQSSDGEIYHMYYTIRDDAYGEMSGLGKGKRAELKDIFLIDDNLNIKYIDKNGKEYGDNIEDKILQDETEIKFFNKEFGAYVSKISGAPEEKVKFKWMKTQTSLTITDKTITSIEDLVFFPNLTSLSIGTWGKGLNLENLNGIENCPKLVNVDIIASVVDKLDGIEKLNNLVTLGIRQANVKDFSKISQIENLVSLSIEQKCSVEEIVGYLENNTTLKILHLTGCNDNIVSTKCISRLKGNLTNLSLSKCGIQRIEGLEKFKDLKLINLQSNDIIDITPLAANTKLTSIDLIGNKNIEADRANYSAEQIEKLNQIGKILENGGSIQLNVDKLVLFTTYKSLNLNNQGLTTLECLRGMTELETLTLDGNPLTFEDEASLEIIKSMKKLKMLNLRFSAAPSISFVNELDSLTRLQINNVSAKSGIVLKQIEDKISQLFIYTDEKIFNTLVDCDVNKITKLNFRFTSITKLPDLSKFTKLTSITFSDIGSNCDLKNITNIISLETISLSGNNLHDRLFDLSNLTNLNNLNLSSNYLSSSDLVYIKTLKNNKNMTINLSSNSIIDASALLELDPSTKIDIRNNKNLTQESKETLKARFGSNVTY